MTNEILKSIVIESFRNEYGFGPLPGEIKILSANEKGTSIHFEVNDVEYKFESHLVKDNGIERPWTGRNVLSRTTKDNENNKTVRKRVRRKRNHLKIKIYQIDADLDKNRVKFLDYDGTIMTAGKIDPKIYKTVYSGDVSTTNLEDIFAMFNVAPPKNYNAHSMSVSDIVEISECPIGKEGCYFCDNVDWKKLDDFDTSLTKPMDGLRVVMIEPGKQAYETFVRNNLESFQKAVEGDIERTYPFDDDVAIIGNEEAKLIGMPGNRRINGGIYAGPIFIVGITETGYIDLTDEQTEHYLKMFNTPDNISDEEVAQDVDCGVYIVEEE